MRGGYNDDYSINRNIVECKDDGGKTYPFGFQLVLIETLWNVKIENYDRQESWTDSINRNIVECKVLRCLERCSVLCRINRNIVECKAFYSL